MTRKYYLAGFGLLAASLLATAILYPHLPSQIPTHWNAQGQVDHYGAKWTLFTLHPAIMLGILGIFAVLPWLSPRRFEVDTFRATYLYIMLVMLVCFVYFQALMLWSAWAGNPPMVKAVTGGICLLFALLGNVLGKVRRNFYIGIRTPWALANERVWNATHRFAAKSFVASGVIGLLVTLLGFSGWPVFLLLMVGAVAPVAYSLMFYKRLKRQKQL